MIEFWIWCMLLLVAAAMASFMLTAAAAMIDLVDHAYRRCRERLSALLPVASRVTTVRKIVVSVRPTR